MFDSLVSKIFGDKKQRTYKRLKPIIDKVNEWDQTFNSLQDGDLPTKTAELKARLAEGEPIDDVLPEAFALVKQACRRLRGTSWEAGGSAVTWDIVPYDVQLAGGIELHRGNIAEMATGEGKTLVATLPLYLNALMGKGAHLITVNDYLARRDSEWMGQVYRYLGLTVGCILTDMTPDQRRVSYACDITYGTNNEFGFDYLRDNMAHSVEQLVQRPHFYAIVDEVDSVLIDEARTPLIISGTVDRTNTHYVDLRPNVADLVRRQTLLVNKIVGEAEELLKEAEGLEKSKREEKVYEAGIKLLQARKGHPKHKRLAKVMGEASSQRLVERVEHDFMRDKRMPEIDEELFFVVDEKGHSIDLALAGREALSPNDPDLYLVPDIVEMTAEIEGKDIPRAEKDKLREAAMAETERKTETIHSLSQLLRAFVLYDRDVEYVVQDNKVIIVDEFTGRLMNGRRWSDGLHSAVEAKEGVKLEKETQTLATITLQNYFRMYNKLAGMTGTAETEASEFGHTYKMDVAVIPTNRHIYRQDDDDLIYKTQREKYNAIVERVQQVNESGMPILIGTVSVDVSEKLSRLLQRAKLNHSVLNAKQHAREAEIVRDAGQIGAVTIATNMAGRGTDIKLAKGVIRCQVEGYDGKCCAVCPHKEKKGLEEDPELMTCGLHILGTERHESRRIDRQLRGRAGRQGDPGYSQFFVSLEDDLMRLFASERMAALMGKGFEEGEAMSHRIATNAITKAQRRIEEINFERRKRTLEYDNVMNKQRTAIYDFRRGILRGDGALTDIMLDVAYEAIVAEAAEFGEPGDADRDKFDFHSYMEWIRRHVPMVNLDELTHDAMLENLDGFHDEVNERVLKAYEQKIEVFGEGLTGALSRYVTLNIIDSNWRDHLLAIDELREGIWLRGFGQLDPLVEYQREATHMFEDLMYTIYKGCFEHGFRATIVQEPEREATSQMTFVKAEAPTGAAAAATGGIEPAPPQEQIHAAEGDGSAGRRERAAAQAQAAAESEADTGAGAPAEGAGPRRRPPPRTATVRRQVEKVGRNDDCPCGSGKKYKKCCGAPGAAPARPRPDLGAGLDRR